MTAKTYGRVEIDLGGVDRMLERLGALGGDLRDPLDAIGDAWLSRVQLGFTTGTDPWGTPWWPLSPNYRVGQPLRNDGHLMNSFSYVVAGDEMALGTNYGQLEGGGSIAAVHQFGTDRAGRSREVSIPARPMLPIAPGESLPPDWREDATEILTNAIHEALADLQARAFAPPG